MAALVERWFAEITDKSIRRGIFRSVKDLENAIREYIDTYNEDPKPFVWTGNGGRDSRQHCPFCQAHPRCRPTVMI